jgi:hypothetical protein
VRTKEHTRRQRMDVNMHCLQLDHC